MGTQGFLCGQCQAELVAAPDLSISMADSDGRRRFSVAGRRFVSGTPAKGPHY